MKIKLDENLPARLVPILQRHGHDVDYGIGAVHRTRHFGFGVEANQPKPNRPSVVLGAAQK